MGRLQREQRGGVSGEWINGFARGEGGIVGNVQEK